MCICGTKKVSSVRVPLLEPPLSRKKKEVKVTREGSQRSRSSNFRSSFETSVSVDATDNHPPTLLTDPSSLLLLQGNPSQSSCVETSDCWMSGRHSGTRSKNWKDSDTEWTFYPYYCDEGKGPDETRRYSVVSDSRTVCHSRSPNYPSDRNKVSCFWRPRPLSPGPTYQVLSNETKTKRLTLYLDATLFRPPSVKTSSYVHRECRGRKWSHPRWNYGE